MKFEYWIEAETTNGVTYWNEPYYIWSRIFENKTTWTNKKDAITSFSWLAEMVTCDKLRLVCHDLN